MVRAVLYDLDGVIVDSRAVVAAALSDVVAATLGQRPAPDAVTAVVALPPVQAITALGVADAARVFDACFDHAYATHADQAPVVPGMLAVMRRLRAAGVKQAVVTLQCRHRLALLSLDQVHAQLDTVVTFDDARPKPAPDPVLTALDRLEVAADQAWFVGDTVTDIRAGHAAGVPVAAVSWGYMSGEVLIRAGADLLLTEPAQLCAIALAERTLAVGARIGSADRIDSATVWELGADGGHGESAS